jgi:hypothetical protein
MSRWSVRRRDSLQRSAAAVRAIRMRMRRDTERHCSTPRAPCGLAGFADRMTLFRRPWASLLLLESAWLGLVHSMVALLVLPVSLSRSVSEDGSQTAVTTTSACVPEFCF